MSCSGLWAFGRPFSLPGLMMIRQISLGPAPNIKARLLIGQIGVFPQNAFLLCDLKSKQPSVYWAVNPLCYTIVYRVCIRSIYSILHTVCVVYICDYHVDFLVPRCPLSASPQRLKIVLLIFNSFNMFYSFEISWLFYHSLYHVWLCEGLRDVPRC